MQNPGISDIYTQHSVEATVAQYAPSGYYIASGGIISIVVTTIMYKLLICVQLTILGRGLVFLS